MNCQECSELMQRETVVFVTRVRGRLRSTAQPGWYCWTCRTSTHSAADLTLPRRLQPAATLAATAVRLARSGIGFTRTPA